MFRDIDGMSILSRPDFAKLLICQNVSDPHLLQFFSSIWKSKVTEAERTPHQGIF